MNFRNIGALLVALMIAAVPAMAQEQTGSIEGVLTDATGAVVPGATVEARHTSGSVQTTISDTKGAYRFPALAPGSYTVTANLAGFTTVKQADVRLGLGQTLKVDVGMRVSG